VSQRFCSEEDSENFVWCLIPALLESRLLYRWRRGRILCDVNPTEELYDRTASIPSGIFPHIIVSGARHPTRALSRWISHRTAGRLQTLFVSACDERHLPLRAECTIPSMILAFARCVGTFGR
jgi:hypothetical protein